MLRKISAILLSGVMLVSICACGKKDNNKDKDSIIHVFCNDDCKDLLDYLDTVDKSLNVESHDVSKEEEKNLFEEVGKYFGYEIDKLITPFTIINTKAILGFDDENKEEIEKTIKSELKKAYKSIVEKIKKGEDVDGDDKEDDKKPSDETKPSDDKKPSEEAKPATEESIKYTVKKGDYLSRIARIYNTTWKKIYEDNKSIIGNNPNLIKPGQVLTINGVKATSYTVKKGDYLCKIAAMYGTTWKKIYDDNRSVIGNNPNLIKPGQVLVINN